jgi:uncharacterized protein with PIN domain
VQNSGVDITFAVENTLGRLAKWLRLLGFDTLYEQAIPTETSKWSRAGRILLTRTRFPLNRHRSGNCILVKSNDLFDQLAEVIQVLAIRAESIRPFTRCIRCNNLIKGIDKKSVYGQVPDYIWETHETFRVCDQCERIYWPGSHIDQSMEKIKDLFERDDS